MGDIMGELWRKRVLLIAVPLAASALALGISHLVPPTFTARISFLPPQSPQSSAAGALASLGALAGGNASGGFKNSGDQYLALAQSVTVADRLVDRFELMRQYDKELRVDARMRLADNTRLSLGKKDGLIVLEFDDHDPAKAAAIANAYVEELRSLTARLVLTEAQQRRSFFEGQLRQIRDKLTEAQQVLTSTGVGTATLKAEPRATAEGLAKLKAEVTSAEIRLQVLRRSLSDNAVEVMSQTALVNGLRNELAKLNRPDEQTAPSSYLNAYRDYKYQETLFDLISRQYEVAKVDESRDGGQIQVIDAAQPPERKSKPRRSIFMLIAFGATLVLCSGLVLYRRFFKAR